MFTRDGNINWNFQGSPSTSEFDFETVALHEIGHGGQQGHIILSGSNMHYSLSPGFTAHVLSTNEIQAAQYVMSRSQGLTTCQNSVFGLPFPNFNNCGSCNTPNAVCVDTSVSLNQNGVALVQPAIIGSQSTADCGVMHMYLSDSVFTCSEKGINQVVLTVVDSTQQSATCGAIVQVLDDNNLCNPIIINEVDYDNDGTDDKEFIELYNHSGSAQNLSQYTLVLVNGGTNAIYRTIPLPQVTLAHDDYFVICGANGTVPNCDMEFSFATNNIQNGSPDAVALLGANNQVIDALSYEGNVPGYVEGSGSGLADLNTQKAIGLSRFPNGTDTDQNNADFSLRCISPGQPNVTDSVDCGCDLPLAVCSDFTLYPDVVNNVLTLLASDIDSGSTADCGLDTMTVFPSTFDCEQVGSHVAELTVIDVQGNISTCSATVTVSDTMAPDLVCPNDIVVFDEDDLNGACTHHVQWRGPVAGDNCIGVVMTFNGPSDAFTNRSNGSGFLIGTTTNSYLATDNSGNTDTCSFTITVIDTTAPFLICSPDQVHEADSGECGASVLVAQPGYADNCNALTVHVNYTDTNVANAHYPVGLTPIIWTVTDNSGNASTCEQNIIVEDVENPVARCKDATISEDQKGGYFIDASQIDDGSSDNCAISFMEVDPQFLSGEAGDYVVVLTVHDVNENSSSCSATAAIEDNAAPEAVCQDHTAFLNSGGNSTITASDVDDGSNDDDGIQSINVEPSQFSCEDVGPNLVLLTVTDSSENQSTCTATVTVVDSIAPYAVCTDRTIHLTNQIRSGEVEYDNCAIDTAYDSQDFFDCDDIGQNTVVRTVVDVNGNVTTCTNTVTVLDSESPQALCKNITISLDDKGGAAITSDTVDNGSSDNCGFGTITVSPAQFDCNDVGSNEVLLTATDESGNTATCGANVTVLDDSPPSVVCKNVTAYIGDKGSAHVSATQVYLSIDDNCGFSHKTLSQTSFHCVEVGAQSEILTVFDVNNNSTTCSTTITVADTVPPTPFCEDITVHLGGKGGNGGLSRVAAEFDNCEIDTAYNEPDEFSCADVGSNAVLRTVIDVNGNTATCTFTATVVDSEAPSAQCNDTFVDLDGTGNVTISPDDVDNGSFDNCGIASRSLSQSAFNCTEQGSNIVVLSVTDTSGNISTCSATVGVSDELAPVAKCHDVTVFLSENGAANISTTDIDDGSEDNCAVKDLTLDQAQFFCADVGSNVVVLTADDDASNTATCAAMVTVIDSIPPTVICADRTVQLGSNIGPRGGSVESDNCAIDTVFESKTTFNCSDIGQHQVTRTAVDVNGNTSTCTYTATLEDNESPQAVCRNLSVQLDASGNVTVSADSINDGSTDNCDLASVSFSFSAFNCAQAGNNNVVLTVTDSSGNVSTCSASVYVTDESAPTAFCTNATVYLSQSGGASITTADINNGSSDNCAVKDLTLSSAQFNCNDLGANAVSLTVDDDAGNASTCTATVTVIDSIPPLANCMDATVQLDTNGSASISVGMVAGEPGDNCSIDTFMLSNHLFSCADTGVQTVIVQAVDQSGNIGSCSASVTILANGNCEPQCGTLNALCKNDTVWLDNNGVATITPSDIDAGSTASCPIVSTTVDPDSLSCANIGANTVTLTITDQDNNMASCTATVTVIDSLSATATCNDVTVYLDASGNGTLDPADAAVSAADNCGITSYNATAVSFNCSNVGDSSITITIRDDNNNLSSCVSIITIADTLDATLLCPKSDTFTCGTGYFYTVTASDNCGILSVQQTSGLPSGSTFPDGTTVNSFVATDNSGATNSCSFNITIVGGDVPDTIQPKISNLTIGFQNRLDKKSAFGSSMTGLGDLNDDGFIDVAIGASAAPVVNTRPFKGKDAGDVFILYLDSIGNVLGDTVIGEELGIPGDSLHRKSKFGRDLAGLGDLDGDGVEDLAIAEPGFDPKKLGQPDIKTGAINIVFLNANGTVKSWKRITRGRNGLDPSIQNKNLFGSSVANIGDLDRDGVIDLAVGAEFEKPSGPLAKAGAIYILFMNTDGTVKSSTRITDGVGGMAAGTLHKGAFMGSTVTQLGDIDGDGVQDIAAGAWGYNSFDENGVKLKRSGAMHVFLMNTDGTAKSNRVISYHQTKLPLEKKQSFGLASARILDTNLDGLNEMAVGSPAVGSQGLGSVTQVFLTDSGTLDTSFVLPVPSTVKSKDFYGTAIGALNDICFTILGVGAMWDDDGAKNAGAVYLSIPILRQARPAAKMAWFEDDAPISIEEFASNGMAERNSLRFTAFPNPTEGKLFIRFDELNDQAANLRIVDLIGQEHYFTTIDANEQQHELDLETLRSGTYLLVVGNGKEQISKKIVVR